MTQGIDTERLGARLRAARIRTGVSVEVAAKVAGLPGQDLVTIEAGHRAPSLTTLQKLSALYGLTPTELWTTDDEPDLLTRVRRSADDLAALIGPLECGGWRFLSRVLSGIVDVMRDEINATGQVREGSKGNRTISCPACGARVSAAAGIVQCQVCSTVFDGEREGTDAAPRENADATTIQDEG